MSEQELREGLRLAVADEPPMDFDLDELVTTAERLVRRRRALVTVGVSTAAVAVVAVTVPVVLGIGGGAPQEIPVAAPPSASVPSTPPAPPSSAKKPPRSKAQLEERGNQMRTYLNTQLPKVVPAAKNVDSLPFGGEAIGDISDGQTYLESSVKFRFNDKPTAVAVQVRDDQEHQCSGSCQDLPQPDGSKVVLESESGPAGNTPEMTIVSAIHLRKDGTLTRVSTYNYDPTGERPVYQPNVALTQDQLVRLATDPALHL